MIEPIFPDQTCPGCGTEHPGLDCPLQDTLDFGERGECPGRIVVGEGKATTEAPCPCARREADRGKNPHDQT